MIIGRVATPDLPLSKPSALTQADNLHGYEITNGEGIVSEFGAIVSYAGQWSMKFFASFAGGLQKNYIN